MSRYRGTTSRVGLGLLVVVVSMLAGSSACAAGGPPVPLGGSPGGSGYHRKLPAKTPPPRASLEPDRPPENCGPHRP